jgi:tetratricopeptide (TPR) repeat protein
MPPSETATFDAAQSAFMRGDLAAAERLCVDVLSRAPGDSRPWSLLSETALRRGRPDAAIVAAEKAVALDGRDPMARLMRAKCLALDGRVAEAQEAAELGVRLAGGSSAALDGLGAIFSMIGRYDRARDLFQAAVAAAPRDPQPLYNLAAAERMMGRLEEAEAHCDQVIARDRRHALAYYLRADLREQTADRNHIAEMEALLCAGPRNPQSEVLIRFALGKECEDLGRYAQAFRHIKAGAELHRRSLRYDVGDDVARIDRFIRAKGPFAAAAGGFAGDDPIFIVGLPRSGTTLVERIVAAHSAVASAGELGAFPAELRKAAGGRDWTDRSDAIDWASLGQAYCRAARQRQPAPSPRLIDKFPGNYLYCGAIQAALPRARIIAVRRGPLDSCFSLYKAHFAGAWPFSYDLDEMATYYAAFRRLMDHWMETLPAQALLEVAYEDIVADFPGTSRRIVAFLDLPWEDGVLRFHGSLAPSATASAVQVRRPLYASSVGKWRNYAQELEPLRRRLRQLLPNDAIA